MIAIPAIDLREGACVQLVGGSYEAERIRIADPLAVARRWAAAGFRHLHVVDLDAATGRGTNRETVLRLLAESDLEIQVGGGARSDGAIAALLEAGAARVVVGTRAIEDRAWLEDAAARFPGRLLVAADLRGRALVTHGWSERTDQGVMDLVDALDALPLAGLLVTAVDREGRLGGTDLELFGELAPRTRLPLHASGGISTISDLRALASRGCHAAILGMALYTGAIDPAELAAAGFLQPASKDNTSIHTTVSAPRPSQEDPS